MEGEQPVFAMTTSFHPLQLCHKLEPIPCQEAYR
jgi:hypothetical protein